MTKFQSSPALVELRTTPAKVLFKRGVQLASSAARGVEVSGVSLSCRAAAVFEAPASSTVKFADGCGASVKPVGCVSGVGVECHVASQLREVASASGPFPQGPKQGPRSVLLQTIRRSRRAAAAIRFERMQQRLVGSSPGPELPSVSCGVASVASRLRTPVSASLVYSASLGNGTSLSNGRDERIIEKVAGAIERPNMQSMRPVPGASRKAVASVASRPSVVSTVALQSSTAHSGPVEQPVGEWRQIGVASLSVLSRVRLLVDASVPKSGEEQRRMH